MNMRNLNYTIYNILKNIRFLPSVEMTNASNATFTAFSIRINYHRLFGGLDH